MHLFFWLLFIEIGLAIVFYSDLINTGNGTVCYRGIKRSRRDKAYLFVAFFVIFCFHGFRDPMSLADIPYYATAYQEALKYSMNRVIEDGFETLKSETGFRILIKTISVFFSSYIMLFVITSGIIIYCFYNAIKKYSPIVWLSVLIFIVCHFAQSLFMLRAFLAVSLLLLSFPFIIERKIIPFLIINGIAFTIHMSSFIFIPIYFIYGIKSEKLLTILFVVIGAAITIVGFERIILFVVEKIIPEYNYYIVYIDNYEGASWKMPALLGAELTLRFYALRNNFFDEGITRLLSILSIMAFFIYTAGMGFGLTSRMALYFTNMSFLIMSDTVSHIKNRAQQNLIAFFYIAFNGFYLLRDSYNDLYKNYDLILFQL